MSNHKYQTCLHLGIDGDTCAVEHNATVYYHRHAASGDGWNEPREPAYCEVVKIVVQRTYPHIDVELPAWIVDGLEASLQPALLEDWAADDAAAAEYRAEQRADDRMMERLS